MLPALETLYSLGARDDPSFWRRALSRVGLSIAAEWATLYAVICGLSALRAGESTFVPLLLFLGASAIYYWGNGVANVLMRLRMNTVARRLVERIAARLHRLPLLSYESIGRGTLLTRLLGDGDRVATAGRPLLNLTAGLLNVVVAVVFIASLSLEAAAVASAVGLLVVAVSVGRLFRMSEGFAAIAEDEAQLYELLHDQHRGALAIRLHGPRAAALRGAYRGLSAEIERTRVDLWSHHFERQYAYTALVYGLLGVNVFILPLIADIGSEVVRETNLAVLFLFYALVSIVFSMPKVIEGAMAAERLEALNAGLSEEHLEPAEHAVGPGRFADFSALSLDGVSFAYPRAGRRGFSVGPLTATLRRGEIVFITGRNGSGKSTFLKILCGLYPADMGAIRIDGAPVERDDLPHLRALFGTIFTDHFVFERIVDGDSPDVEQRAAALLEEMGLSGKTALSEGRVTERALSTGQLRRLAMVVARLRDRPVLLFDEWAADQDPEFRAYYYQRLLPALRDAGKLVIAVTHDDEHFGLADRTLHLRDGQLVSAGPEPEER